MKLFSEYRGLRRELYVLFFGRIVTAMGSLIWPMLTLILSSKLNMSAGQIATTMLVMTLLQLPASLIGGKVADHFNKRNIIIICDLVTVICYLICGFIKIDLMFVGLFFIAGLFASIEGPAYDALIADMSSSQDREKAYSLNYLGANIGVIVAPTLGGLLFKNYLNLAFIITALATLSSTILIYIFIKDISKVKDIDNISSIYEDDMDDHSSIQVLKKRKTILFYFLVVGVMELVYSQFNYLMPLNLSQLYGDTGAVLFGTLTSLNGLVVIIATPLLTKLLVKLKDVDKITWGEIFMVASFIAYVLIQGNMMVYYFAMIIFTIGEVICTLGKQPYLTRRIPASHRGRIASMIMIFQMIFKSVSQKGIGSIIDNFNYQFAWGIIVVIGGISIVMLLVLKYLDRKEYKLLYSNED